MCKYFIKLITGISLTAVLLIAACAAGSTNTPATTTATTTATATTQPTTTTPPTTTASPTTTPPTVTTTPTATLSALQILENNQVKWNSQTIKNYSFQLKVGCFCPPEVTRAVVVTVKNGISTLTYVDDGSPVTNQYFEDRDTTEDLFTIARSTIQNAAEYTLLYHPDYGIPVDMDIDNIKLAVDDEVRYTISDFKSLDPV